MPLNLFMAGFFFLFVLEKKSRKKVALEKLSHIASSSSPFLEICTPFWLCHDRCRERYILHGIPLKKKRVMRCLFESPMFHSKCKHRLTYAFVNIFTSRSFFFRQERQDLMTKRTLKIITSKNFKWRVCKLLRLA